MHDHIHMIIHSTAFVKPVGGTGRTSCKVKCELSKPPARAKCYRRTEPLCEVAMHSSFLDVSFMQNYAHCKIYVFLNNCYPISLPVCIVVCVRVHLCVHALVFEVSHQDIRLYCATAEKKREETKYQMFFHSFMYNKHVTTSLLWLLCRYVHIIAIE